MSDAGKKSNHKIYTRFLVFISSPVRVFLTLSIAFGVASAVFVPQLSVTDEGMHFLRAYSISVGKFTGSDCKLPEPVWKKIEASFQGTYQSDIPVSSTNTKEVSTFCGSAASYSPIMHIPQAVGVFIAKLLSSSPDFMILLGRLFNLMFYIFTITFIIKKVKLGKWVFVVISLFPLMLHLAGSLSADTMNNVAVFAIVALTLNLFVQTTKISNKQMLVIITVACFAVLSKSINILLLVPLIFLPARLFRKNSVNLPFNIQKWLLAAACIAVCAGALLVWQKLYGAALVSIPADNPLNENPFKFIHILISTYINPAIGYGDLLLRGVVGDFSSFNYKLPLFLVFTAFSLLVFSLAYRDKEEERLLERNGLPLSVGSLIALLSLVLAVTYALYTAWAILPSRLGPNAVYADGVQGRYFTAALLLLIPVSIQLRKYIYIAAPSIYARGFVIFIGSSILLTYYLIETLRFAL